MLAVAVKNIILMSLIILIMHFFIKNNAMEISMRHPVPEVFCTPLARLPPPQAADIRQAMHEELKRFVFDEDECCDPLPSGVVPVLPAPPHPDPPPSCAPINTPIPSDPATLGRAPGYPPAPPLASIAPGPLEGCDVPDSVSCFDVYETSYAAW